MDGRILREPLTWFLLVGALAFVIERALHEDLEDPGMVRIDAALQQAIMEEFELREGRSPLEDERRWLIDQYIDEEVLVREAYERGIDQNDGRIRQILLEKMGFLLAGTIEEPDEQTLRRWYEDNLQRFRLPETRTVTHVYFEDRGAIPAGLLAELRAGAPPTGLGQAFWLGQRLDQYSHQDLAAVLGQAFADTVFNQPRGRWAGPVASARGRHFLRVDEVQEARTPSFEVLHQALIDEWLADQAAKERRRRLDALRSGYEIHVDPPGHPGS